MKFFVGLGIGLAAGFSAGVFAACVNVLVSARFEGDY
jgi:hypothetical protein